MRNEILGKIFDVGAVAVVRLDNDKNAIQVADALKEGGIPIVEITVTTPNALKIIKDLSAEFGDSLIVGVGSVLNEQMAEEAINAGAKYLVSPVMKPELINIAHENGIPAMIGAFTPTEIQTAFEKDADIVKVFPADVLGVNYFKSLLAPMPHLKLMPTGGVNLDNPGEWLSAGACAVGIGSALVNKNAVAEGKFEIIKTSAQKVIESIKKARTIGA